MDGDFEVTDSSTPESTGVRRQEEIRDRCRHPSGHYTKISDAEIISSIPKRFEEQVIRFADRIAFTDEAETITYQQLNMRANRIAHGILSSNTDMEEPVVALMDEGADRISSFLGILKAGRCHVALSPELPFERQKYILEQSGARLLIVQDSYVELGLKLAKGACEVLKIRGDTDYLTNVNPGIEIPSDQACWIVYTSGSTGQPKGVIQTHRTMLHDMRTYANGFHISQQDRLSLLMSLTTNAGCFGTLMALCNGATLCRIDVQGRGVDHMTQEIARQELTIWGGVPSLFRQWLTFKLPEYSKLRLVWFGGEAVHKRDLELFQKHLKPPCLFVNRLGSTETGCICMYYADQQTHISGSTVPVGYAVQGQEILLENTHTHRTGEIVVQSSYLSPGYWKRDDLTQTAYRDSAGKKGSRKYYTGDLGHMEEDGCLTYLGRKDFQVQIRGYRVEIAEVETILDQLDSLSEVAVNGESLDDGGHELVAYVVPKTTEIPSITELRRELTVHLPDYMIPSRFIFLEMLPRAGNGKIVRNQLAKQKQIPSPLDSPSLAPRTPIEKTISEIWEEVLELGDSEGKQQRISIHDNFFELGGHSLKASQVTSRIRTILSVDVPLRLLFDFPTIKGLAQEVEKKNHK